MEVPGCTDLGGALQCNQLGAVLGCTCKAAPAFSRLLACSAQLDTICTVSAPHRSSQRMISCFWGAQDAVLKCAGFASIDENAGLRVMHKSFGGPRSYLTASSLEGTSNIAEQGTMEMQFLQPLLPCRQCARLHDGGGDKEVGYVACSKFSHVRDTFDSVGRYKTAVFHQSHSPQAYRPLSVERLDCSLRVLGAVQRMCSNKYFCLKNTN